MVRRIVRDEHLREVIAMGDLHSDPTYTKRSTGRTTRMLQEAYRLADAGRIVYIYAGTAQNTARLEAQIAEERGARYAGVIKVLGREIPQDFLFERSHETVLVDHFAAEQEAARLEARLARVRELARRFDQ